MDKNEHDINHDSKIVPIPECEWCAREVYRRTHRCFGDGGSNVPAPVKPVATVDSGE